RSAAIVPIAGSSCPARPELASTLYAYTPLFRSPLQGVVEVERTASGVEETVTTYVGYSSGEAPPVVALEEGLARLAAECTVVSIDRKSTRLNSSHVKRSHAACCS